MKKGATLFELSLGVGRLDSVCNMMETLTYKLIYSKLGRIVLSLLAYTQCYNYLAPPVVFHSKRAYGATG